MKDFVVVVVVCVFAFIFKEQDNFGFQVKEYFWEMILTRNVLDMLLLKGDRLFVLLIVF